MATDLFEELLEWHAGETQTAVFRSLLAVEIVALSVEDVPGELLDAVRCPLRDLYELSRDHEEVDDV